MKNVVDSLPPPTPTPVKPGQDVPRGVGHPVYRHSSGTMRSPNDAGGAVPPGFYEGGAPKNV